MKKGIIITVSIAVLIGIAAVFEIGKNATPINRNDISSPIYTIGDKSYELALKENKAVVKFGPMFMGMYPGGLAFSNPEAARKYMIENDWDVKKWDVYQLSGDYDRDVRNGHIDKSLRVLNKVQIIEQQH